MGSSAKYYCVYIVLVILLVSFASATVVVSNNSDSYKWIKVTVYKNNIIVVENMLYKKWPREQVYRGALISNLTMFSKLFREALAEVEEIKVKYGLNGKLIWSPLYSGTHNEPLVSRGLDLYDKMRKVLENQGFKKISLSAILNNPPAIIITVYRDNNITEPLLNEVYQIVKEQGFLDLKVMIYVLPASTYEANEFLVHLENAVNKLRSNIHIGDADISLGESIIGIIYIKPYKRPVSRDMIEKIIDYVREETQDPYSTFMVCIVDTNFKHATSAGDNPSIRNMYDTVSDNSTYELVGKKDGSSINVATSRGANGFAREKQQGLIYAPDTYTTVLLLLAIISIVAVWRRR